VQALLSLQLVGQAPVPPEAIAVSQVSPEFTTLLPQSELVLFEPHAETSNTLINPTAIIEPIASPLVIKFLLYYELDRDTCSKPYKDGLRLLTATCSREIMAINSNGSTDRWLWGWVKNSCADDRSFFWFHRRRNTSM
jgi:hypothetical protein